MLNIRTDLEKSMIKYEKTTNKKIFEKNVFTSLYYVFENLLLIFGLYYVCYKIKVKPKLLNNNKLAFYFVTMLCLFLIGTLFWGQFVLGHDMGHESFSDNFYLNKFLGIITHGTILVPFQQWRCSHRKHHKNTGNIDDDEIFKPIKRIIGYLHLSQITLQIFHLFGYYIYYLVIQKSITIILIQIIN